MSAKLKSKQEGTIVAASPFKWIEDMFADYKPVEKRRMQFDFFVAVCGRLDSPGPMDSRWDMIRDHGMPLYDKIRKREPIGAGPHFFIFPDRWLVPAEAQAFLSHLAENPDAGKFGKVYVVTHQPYIVGDCLKEQVRIVTVN